MSEAGTPQPMLDLLKKLHEVAKAVDYVKKRGRNDRHGYSYAQAVDVTRTVRAELLDRGVIVVPETTPGSVQHYADTGGRGFVTTVDLLYRFVDTESGATIAVPWAGAGADIGGDKGLYKAYTGALKYALLGTFLLPMTDDPEQDALTEQGQAKAGVAKDAERPAAPVIPRDRAEMILDAALAAGLAERKKDGEAPVFKPVLKAKLADLGAEKIGLLNVDQAEALEAFIAEEAKP